MVIFKNIRFVKTRSSVYTPFHKEARNINFEIGYSKESKWLDYLDNKWNNYESFFITGFFEGIYTATNEKGPIITYIQVEAKLVDFDVKYRTNISTPKSNQSSSSQNIFARRRSQGSTSHARSSDQTSTSTTPIHRPKQKLVDFYDDVKSSMTELPTSTDRLTRKVSDSDNNIESNMIDEVESITSEPSPIPTPKIGRAHV